MKQVTIKDNFKMEAHRHKLEFEGRMPLVIAYCRTGKDDDADSALIIQMSAIHGTLARRFGRYGCDVVWIVDEAERGLHSPGLSLALEMIRQGTGNYVAVHRLDRITRKAVDFLALLDEIRPFRVTVLTAWNPWQGRTGAVKISEKAMYIASGVEHERRRRP